MLSRKADKPFNTNILTSNEVISAIKRSEFKAYYQPKIELNSLELAGLELLVRWQHPHFGLLMPGKFLPIVINSGLLNEVTHSLVDQALITQDALLRSGISAPMALNLEARQISNSSFISALIAQVNRHSTLSQPLTIEITENSNGALYSSRFIRNIAKMNAAKWRLSIDDFGTGYSSLERICQIPCSEVKIDRSFIQKMQSDQRYRKMVRQIVAIGDNMQINVVAEGVETLEQLNYLQALGCNQGQGHLFSAALSSSNIQQWCLRWSGALLL